MINQQKRPVAPSSSQPVRRPFVSNRPTTSNPKSHQPRVFRNPNNKVANSNQTFKPTAPVHHLRPSAPRVREANEGTKLRIMVVGGLEEVGRNCTFIEYGNDIIIIDMGLQFPEEDMPGIDYIIPNISYLKGKEKNIRGVIITHAHYDHIGGIPHLIPVLGYPPIYGLPLTNAIIKKRQEDYKNLSPLNIHNISLQDKLKLGVFELEFFHLNHNIPDSMGVVVNTPEGIVVHTGDWKFDYQPVAGDQPADLQ